MVEEGSLEFRLRKIDETRSFLLDEITHNDLMGEKYKKACKYLNFVEHLLILVSTIIGCVSLSGFSSLISIPVDITSSGVRIKTWAITAGIKKYKSITNKKNNNHDKIRLFEKDNLNTVEVLISKVLIDLLY